MSCHRFTCWIYPWKKEWRKVIRYYHCFSKFLIWPYKVNKTKILHAFGYSLCYFHWCQKVHTIWTIPRYKDTEHTKAPIEGKIIKYILFHNILILLIRHLRRIRDYIKKKKSDSLNNFTTSRSPEIIYSHSSTRTFATLSILIRVNLFDILFFKL